MPILTKPQLTVPLRLLGWSVVGALAGLASGTMTERYQSTAILSLASPGEGAANAARFMLTHNAAERERMIFNLGMSIPDYRRVRALIASPANFTSFAQRANVDEAMEQRLRTHLATEKALAELIAPIYTQTRIETRDVGESKLDRSEPGVSALHLSFAAAEPKTSVAGIKLLAAYVQDTLLRDSILTQLIRQAAIAHSIRLSANAESLDRRFAIAQIEATLRDLRRIVQQYPSSARLEGRQVVSVEGEGGRYLSPIAQIVAAESRLSEARRELDRLARLTRQADAALRFFQAAEPIATNRMLPSVVICDELIKLVHVHLDAPEAKDDAAQARLLELLTWLSDLRSIHVDQVRLLAEPSMPEQPQPPTAVQLGFAGALVGLFLSLAAGVFRPRPRPPRINQHLNQQTVEAN